MIQFDEIIRSVVMLGFFGLSVSGVVWFKRFIDEKNRQKDRINELDLLNKKLVIEKKITGMSDTELKSELDRKLKND